jgi:hypothetical protein
VAGSPIAPYSHTEPGVHLEDGRATLLPLGDAQGEDHPWARRSQNYPTTR